MPTEPSSYPTHTLKQQYQSAHYQQEHFFSSLRILNHATATPLTNLLINLQLVARDPALGQSQSNCALYLKRALLATKYLKEIMSHSLNHQQNQKSFQVKSALLELIELCKQPKQKGMLVPFLQLSPQDKLNGNKLYFQEAVICLINNSFKAYKQTAANMLVVLMALIEQDQLILKVADGASGVLCLRDVDTQTTPVQPSRVHSTGVGLQFVNEVVENHFGGKVLIQSTNGKGTTVHCTFPLSRVKQ